MEFKKLKRLVSEVSEYGVCSIVEKMNHGHVYIDDMGVTIDIVMPCPIDNYSYPVGANIDDIKMIFKLLEDYPKKINIESEKINIGGYKINTVENSIEYEKTKPITQTYSIDGYDYSMLKNYIPTTRSNKEYLRCVYIEGSFACATDAFILIKHKITVDKTVDKPFTIPKMITKHLPEQFKVNIVEDDTVGVIVGNVSINFGNGASDYPDFSVVMDELSNTDHIKVNPKILVKQINNIKKLKEEFIHLEDNAGDMLSIKTYKPENGIEYEKTIPCNIDNKIDIVFKTKQLYNLINTFKNEKNITVNYTRAIKPVYIQTDTITAIVMPCRK